MVLRAEPLCADPFGIHGAERPFATQVDHILPLCDGGTDAVANLQGLCASCHTRKTYAEKRGPRIATACLDEDGV